MPSLPDGYRVEYSDQPCREQTAHLHELLKAHNTAVSPAHRLARDPAAVTPLNLFVYDDAGEFAAGLSATTYWGWLDIDDLWIHENLRGQGRGARLMYQAEREAIRRGCQWAQLKTFHFQARGFYEKLGYRMVGELADYPPGGSFFWMRKDLARAHDDPDP